MRGEWIRKPEGGSSVIFVHGILSSGETSWLNKNGSYWPHLLKNESDLTALGIYVFTYQTGIFSGSYRLSDIVDALKEYTRLDGIMESNRLIFVCHSMGGIVVRKFLLEQAVELTKTGKEIQLFLVASPSLGSSYADWLSPLAKLFGHAQGDALRFVRNNDWLKDLDKEFLNLKESSGLRIKGKELIEDKFIALKKFWGRQVVEPFSGARYFGEPFKVPASDHFSIAKPIDSGAIQHRLLCRFVLENQRAVRTEPIPNVSSTAVSTETRVVAADSGFAPDVPKISIKGFSAVDEEEIDLIIDRYGTDWPEVRIAWPQASDTLISIIRNAIDRFDEEGIGLAGSEYFIKHAPSALAAVVKKRDFFQKRLSGVVRRVREFEREYIKVAVKNCLLFGNYALHRTLIYHSSWGGLPALKLRVPPAVANFHGVLTLEHAYAKLFNETDEFYHGRITEIGDQWERSLGDSNIYIFAPKRILFKSGIRITDKHTICTWFIPQFELEAPDDAALPDRYSGEWAFLVVENERNWEI